MHAKHWIWWVSGAVAAVAVAVAAFLLIPSATDSPEGVGKAVADAINDGDGDAYRDLVCPGSREAIGYELPTTRQTVFIASQPLRFTGGPVGEVATLAQKEGPDLALGISDEGGQQCVWLLFECIGKGEQYSNPLAKNLCTQRPSTEGPRN